MRKLLFFFLILYLTLYAGITLAADGPNLIANSSVEFNSGGGLIPDSCRIATIAGTPFYQIDKTQSNSGVASVKIDTFTDSDRGQFEFGSLPLKPGTKVKIGLHYKTGFTSGSGTVALLFRKQVPAGTLNHKTYNLELNKSEWTSFTSGTIIIPDDALNYNVAVQFNYLVGSLWIDDVWLQVIDEDEDYEPPIPAQNLVASRQGNNRIHISWQQPPAASDGDLPCLYRIYRDTNKDFNPNDNNLISEVAGNMTNHFDYVADGVRYYYIIAAIDKMDNVAYSNQVVASETFTIGDNLFPNGGFEQWDLTSNKPIDLSTSGRAGAVTPDETYKVDGNYSAQITNLVDSEYNTVGRNNIPIKTNTDYIIVGWIKGENIIQKGYGARLYTTITSSTTYNGTFDWQEIRIPFNSGSKTTISILGYLHQSSGKVWFDGFGLYEVATIDGTPPEAPKGIVAARVNGTTQVKLNWQASEAAPDGDLPVKYRIYRGNTLSTMKFLGEVEASNTSWVDQNATGNSCFYYYLTALDATGNESDPSDEIAFVDKTASIKGRVLFSLGDQSALSDRATLTLVEVDLSTESLEDGSFLFDLIIAGDYTLLVTAPCHKKQSISIIELTPGEERKIQDIELEWDDIKPNEPKNLKADGETHVGLIDLTWDEPDPAEDQEVADFYNIYRSLTPDVQRIETQLIASISTNFFRDIMKEENWGKTFYYIVEAVDSAGNPSEFSSNSDFATVKTPPIPQIISPSERELFIDEAPNFEWEMTSDPDISGYVIEVSKDSAFPQGKTFKENAASLSFTWPNQLEQSLWFWRVKARFNTGIESNWSCINEFVTSTLIENTKLAPYINVVPNVFHGNQVKIVYLITEQSEIQIKAYNLGGKLVTNIKNENQNPGYHEAIWEGKDLNGKELFNGLYFVQVVAKSESKREKVIKKVVIYR